MGIDLALTARIPRSGLLKTPAKKILERAAAVIEEVAADRAPELQEFEDERGKWFVARLHPAAEDLRFGVTSGQVVLEARTSGAGPGYHEYVVWLAEALGSALGLEWTAEDETGYFESRDRGALEREMLGWISFLCRAVLEQAGEAPDGPLGITMPLGVSVKEESFAVTPLGPRTRAWSERVAADPGAGREFFSWWERKPSAVDLRSEALVHMWMECRWVRPRTEAEARTIERVLDLLGRAHDLEPGLEMPWREWSELMAIAGEEGPLRAEVEARAAGCPEGRLAGYLRSEEVGYMLPGGWLVEVPGSMTVDFEEESATWIAWDESRTVRVSSMGGQMPAGAELPPPTEERLPPGAEPVSRRVEGGRAGGFFVREVEEGREFETFSGEMLVRDGSSLDIGLITISFDEPGDRGWALQVWESLRLGRAVEAGEG